MRPFLLLGLAVAAQIASSVRDTEIKKAVGQWRPDYWRV